jgi:hypothetical protein
MSEGRIKRVRRSSADAAANPMIAIGGQVPMTIDAMLNTFAKEFGINRSEALRRLIPAGIAALKPPGP